MAQSLTVADLEAAYVAIEAKMTEVETYHNSWKLYGSLWRIDTTVVLRALRDDIEKWSELLEDFKASRRTLNDAEDADLNFGPIVVETGHVRQKVANKFDSWAHEVLDLFAQKVGWAANN